MHPQRAISAVNTARVLIGRRSFRSTTHATIVKRYTSPIAQPQRFISTAARYIPRVTALRSHASTISQVRYYSASEVQEDPEREGLYYHPIGDNVFALSFLSEKPPSQDSATVIGLIPSDKGLSSFQENQAFVDLLHDTVKAALIEGADEEMVKDASRRQEGWIHVQDWRNLPEMGRVGDPDSILGSVLVQNGKINGETYQRMPSYRTCTTDGPLKLSPTMHERLLKTLKEVHRKESKA